MRQLTFVATVACLMFSSLRGVGHAQDMAFPGAEWETVTPESQRVDSTMLRVAVDFLEGREPQDGAEELVIVRNGRVIWQGLGSHNAHDIWSATKTFGSTVLGLLIDDGVIALDSLARNYVPSMALEYPDVTLRHLATQTSGYIAEGESYPQGTDDPDFIPTTPFDPAPPLFTPPGSQFAYGTSYEQLMHILTRAAGEPLQDVFQRRIGNQIGLDPASWDWGDFLTADGIVVEGGEGWPGKAINISALDAARFGHLFLNKGDWDGQQLISSTWIDEATSVQVPRDTPWYPQSFRGPGEYGYAWWVNGVGPSGDRLLPSAPPGTYFAWGSEGNLITVVPEWDMVVVRFGTRAPMIWASTWSDFLGKIGSSLIWQGQRTVSLDEIYTVIDNDSDSIFDGEGDTFNFLASKPVGGVGESDSASNNAISRLVAAFNLPGGPGAAPLLQSAKLRFFLEEMVGTPAGPVSVWHSIADNDSLPFRSDYEDDSYGDTLLDLVQPTDPDQAYYEVDVTNFVLADYAADGANPMSAFRLQIDEVVFDEDDQSHRYRFTMPGAERNHPELVLTFIPEPSTLALTIALGLLCWRREGR